MRAINPQFPHPSLWAYEGTVKYLEAQIEEAVELWERARAASSLVAQDRILLVHYYESVGRHDEAQAIVQEMLSVQPEMTAERGVEVLAGWWNEEWIPDDLEEKLRSAGLP